MDPAAKIDQPPGSQDHVDLSSGSASPISPSNTREPIDRAAATSFLNPSRLARLMSWLATPIWFGFFAIYLRVWLGPQSTSGALEKAARLVASGHAPAPHQYRILIPMVVVWMHDHLGVSVGQAATAVDALALGIGAFLAHRLFRRLGLSWYVLPAVCYIGFLGMGLMWWGKFETMTAFAAVVAATGVLVADRRRSWVVLLAATLVLMGTRTDVLASLACAFGVRWWLGGRQRGDLIAAVGTMLAAIGATAGLMLRYSGARYEIGTDPIQISHNLTPFVFLTALAFLLPVLGLVPLALRDRGMRRALEPARAVLWPLLALVGAEVGVNVVVGRIDEVRLFFPIAVPLAVAGVLLWQAAFSAAGVLRNS